MTGLIGGLAILLWWLFFSRALWSERLGAVALMVVAMLATQQVAHVSIATGAMGFMLPMLAIPGLSLAFVAWAVLSNHLQPTVRRATMAAAILGACGVWAIARTGGFSGSFDNDLAFRWSPTPEERLLARGDEPLDAHRAELVDPPTHVETTSPALPASTSPDIRTSPKSLGEAAPAISSPMRSTTHDWPGFRGADRNGISRGVRINTDWEATPPVELWRRPIGPGWSSFAVSGDVFYTQEQRGEEEVVAAYRVSTGQPVWKHRDAARFWESNGGAGPRGTPTLHHDRVYALGATGILNALVASNGRVIWSRNVSAESQTKVPDWGFAASPLVVGDLVVVAAAGKLVAYDAATGAPRWSAPGDDVGYSSPHLSTIGSVPQILLVNGHGVSSVSPPDGKRLWDYSLKSGGPIVQPALTPDGDLLIANGDGRGLHRIAVTQDAGTWTAVQRWMSIGLKPFFNDFVVHRGHAFGFDGAILACVDLADGTRKWKGGRYGNGQLILLEDQDVLLVLSEEGELALVSALTDKYTELARRPAIEGKTWNHPVLVGDVLLVRNAQEMAAYRLSRLLPRERAASGG
jgi:outer membrane protein assembly factor BamB